MPNILENLDEEELHKLHFLALRSVMFASPEVYKLLSTYHELCNETNNETFKKYWYRKLGLDTVFIEIENRPAIELFYVPALLLLGVVVWRQRQRYRVTKRQET